MLLNIKFSLIFIFISVFVFVFNLKLNIPPYNLVLFIFLISFLYFFGKKSIDKKMAKPLFLVFFQFFLLLLSFFVNQVVDFFYFKEILLFQFISIFVSCFLINYAASRNLFFNDIFEILVFAIFFQLIISFFGYINPVFFEYLNLLFDFGSQDLISKLYDQRMVGLGAAFFGSGVINCIILILISSFVVTSNSNKEKFKFLFYFVSISILGMLSARSTIIGSILGLLILFLNLKNIKIKIYLIIFIIFISFFVNFFLKFEDTRVGQLINFTFGVVKEGQDANLVTSVLELLDMYTLVPESMKTWIIGDGLFREGFYYYKDTDIGYFRIIYATGLMGLTLYCYTNLYLIFNIFSARITLISKLCMAILFFILMAKGVAIFFPIILLLYMASNTTYFSKLKLI